MQQHVHAPAVKGSCPICQEPVSYAGGRGFCPACFVTFAQPRPKRKDVLATFQLRYFMSRTGSVYHREGCKYLRNIDAKNLVVTTEPWGRACQCVQ